MKNLLISPSKSTNARGRSIASILGLKLPLNTGRSSVNHTLMPSNIDTQYSAQTSRLPSLSKPRAAAPVSSSLSLAPVNKDVDTLFAEKVIKLKPDLKQICAFYSDIPPNMCFLYIKESTITHLLNILQKVIFHPTEDLTLEDQYGDFQLSVPNENISDLKKVHDLFTKILQTGPKETISKWLINEKVNQKAIHALLYSDQVEVHLFEQLILTIYKCFPICQKYLISTSFQILNNFLFNLKSYHGINTILQFLEMHYSVGSSQRWTTKESRIIKEVCIPLLANQFLSQYYTQLDSLLLFSYGQDVKLAKYTLDFMIKYWPLTNTKKQICYLNHMLNIATNVHIVNITSEIPKMFNIFVTSVKSQNFKVATEALKVCRDINLIFTYTKDYLYLIKQVYDAAKIATYHWSPDIRKLAGETLQAIYNVVPKIDSVSSTPPLPTPNQQKSSVKEDPKEVWSILSKQVGFKPKGELDKTNSP